MPNFVKVNGVWRSINESVKVNGVYRSMGQLYVKVDDVWRETLSVLGDKVITFLSSGTFYPSDYNLLGRKIAIYLVGGGGGGASLNVNGDKGGDTTAFGYSAPGGKGGKGLLIAGLSPDNNPETCNGGDGGSGGGASRGGGGEGGSDGEATDASLGLAVAVTGIGGKGGGTEFYTPINPFDNIAYGCGGGGIGGLGGGDPNAPYGAGGHGAKAGGENEPGYNAPVPGGGGGGGCAGGGGGGGYCIFVPEFLLLESSYSITVGAGASRTAGFGATAGAGASGLVHIYY